jgi:hypothetical protein
MRYGATLLECLPRVSACADRGCHTDTQCVSHLPRMSVAARSQLHEFKLARSTWDIIRPGTDGGHSQRDLNS